MEKTYDIVVGGGGIIGSVMALAFAEQGLSVALVDEMVLNVQVNKGFDGRAYALSATTVKMLSVLGLWKELSKTAQPILEMKVSDGIAGKGASPFFMHFDHQDMESGPIGYMVEDRFFKSILFQKLNSKGNISKFFDGNFRHFYFLKFQNMLISIRSINSFTALKKHNVYVNLQNIEYLESY